MVLFQVERVVPWWWYWPFTLELQIQRAWTANERKLNFLNYQPVDSDGKESENPAGRPASLGILQRPTNEQFVQLSSKWCSFKQTFFLFSIVLSLSLSHSPFACSVWFDYSTYWYRETERVRERERSALARALMNLCLTFADNNEKSFSWSKLTSYSNSVRR